MLYLVRDLHLSALAIGLVFAVAGLCAIPGAMLAGRVAGRIGVGHAIVGGWLIEAARPLVPAAAGPTVVILALLIIGQSIDGVAGTTANIHQWAMRQPITRDALLGRVTAAHRFLAYGFGAIGALIGGVLSTTIGLRRALLRCAAANVAVRLPAVRSALRAVTTHPAVVDAEEVPTTEPVLVLQR